MDENFCEAYGLKFKAVPGVRCRKCRGEWNSELCESLGPCAPGERSDGQSIVWMIATDGDGSEEHY